MGCGGSKNEIQINEETRKTKSSSKPKTGEPENLEHFRDCLKKLPKVIKDKSPCLINEHLPSHNHSAERIKKYFKDQGKYYGSEEFVDELFPPKETSLFGSNTLEKAFEEFGINSQNIVWKRISEVVDYSKSACLFCDNMEYVHGQYVASYINLVFEFMTNHSHIPIQIFRSFFISSNGYYELVMKINGEWQVIVLDDYIPCNSQTMMPIFTAPQVCRHNKNVVIWYCLLEKAWAKVNGSYLNILNEEIPLTVFLKCFTIFPLNKINTKKEKQSDVWTSISGSCNKGHIIGAKSCHPGVKELSPRSFQVTSVKILTHKKKSYKLVSLNKPSTEYWKKYLESLSLKIEFLLDEEEFDIDIRENEIWVNFSDFYPLLCEIDILTTDEIYCSKGLRLSNIIGQDSRYSKYQKGYPLFFKIENFSKSRFFLRFMLFNREDSFNPIIDKCVINNSSLKAVISKKLSEDNVTRRYTEEPAIAYKNNEDDFFLTLSADLEEGVYFIYVTVTSQFNDFFFNFTNESLFNLSLIWVDLDLSTIKTIDSLIAKGYTDSKLNQELNQASSIENMNMKKNGQTVEIGGYDWIYKNYNIFVEKIDHPIDNIKLIQSYFSIKYPDKMARLLILQDDNDEFYDVEFNDIYCFKDTNFQYFGEWRCKTSNEMHGKGILFFEPDFYYLGYFFQNKLDGRGRVYFKNGERFEINFENGEMDGEGAYYLKNGTIKTYYYSKGIYIKTSETDS